MALHAAKLGTAEYGLAACGVALGLHELGEALQLGGVELSFQADLTRGRLQSGGKLGRLHAEAGEHAQANAGSVLCRRVRLEDVRQRERTGLLAQKCRKQRLDVFT